MANWCSNTVVVTGPEEELARFREKALGVYPCDETARLNALNFQSFLPLPPTLLSLACGEGRESWEVENWGCQYGAVNSSLSGDEGVRLVYTFDTKWAPPAKFFIKIGPLWPTLVFKINSLECNGGHHTLVNVGDGQVEVCDFRVWCRLDLYTTQRPGYPSRMVTESEVKKSCARFLEVGIKTILCLLDEAELAYYRTVPGGLLGCYQRTGFTVVHRPVNDHQAPPVPNDVLPVIYCDFKAGQKPVLVHCSAGQDRSQAVAAYVDSFNTAEKKVGP